MSELIPKQIFFRAYWMPSVEGGSFCAERIRCFAIKYEAHVGGQLSKESFTEKRESLLRAQNEKKRQLAQLESDWELLCAEEENAKKEERQTSVLSPYHEISA